MGDGFNTLRALSAEFLASIFLIFIGCGATVALAKTGSTDETVHAALSWGFAYMTVIFIFSHLSGAVVNPALIVSLVVTKNMAFIQGFMYIIVEIVGSIIGAAIVNSVTGRNKLGNLGVTTLGSGVSSGEGFGMEVVITFILTLVVYGVGNPKLIGGGSLRDKAIIIAFTAAVLNFIAGPFSGASFNPIRSFGPAVVARVWTSHWVYWIGPLVGAILAGIFNETWLNPRSSTTSDDSNGKNAEPKIADSSV